MIAVCALLLLVAVHIVPGVLAAAHVGTPAALDYIAAGVEASALWGAVLVLARGPLRYVAAWGLAESLERAGCRALLPLDRAPVLAAGQNLCDAASGMPISLLSLVAALGLAAALETRAASRR
jgi:hypothetical protein